jgi:DNA helicase-2/ATP-dependent DNA helicase PcrA
MLNLDELNIAQKEAVQAIKGPVMVIAGAGSGKTKVLTYRVAYLISKGVSNDSILALTFTNKAASEMKERVKKMIGKSSDGLWMGTFHSIFSRILRSECDKIGYNSNYSIVDTNEGLVMIKNIMAGLNIPTENCNPYSVHSSISRAKNKMMSPNDLANKAGDTFGLKVAEIYKEYQAKLKNNNCMDFDDLLLLPIMLFQDFPHILDKYRTIFKYILVDEYQDTNRAQYILIKLLASKHKNLCVVGDDAQSIYSFRGAEIQNILDFQTDFKEHKLFRLEQNYRSTKKILEAADCIIKNNQGQIKKKLWTDNEEGENIVLLDCRDEKDEGLQIVRNIESLVKKDKLPLSSFAILYRTNAQSRAIEESLRRNGVPYNIVGGIKFYERKEIKDILAYLKFISNPLNEEALDRIINYPARGIGVTSLNKVKQHAYKNKIPLFSALEQVEELKNLQDKFVANCKIFTNFINKYIRLKNEMSLSEFTISLIGELGLLESLKQENTPESLIRYENIQEFISGVMEFCNSRRKSSLENFLQEVSLLSDIDTVEDSKNAVTLMTIHASKGLEYTTVFITGLEENLFPHANSLETTKEIEEERRLFYVAVTRAKIKLFLSYAKMRYRYGHPLSSVKSRFIKEIDKKLLYNDSVELVEKNIPTIGPDDVKWIKIPEKKKINNSFVLDKKYNKNDIVIHPIFGEGIVSQIMGFESDLKLIVDFDKVGRKTLMAQYANLIKK